MGKLRVLILLPLVVCFSLATVKAQTRLQLGTPIERRWDRARLANSQ